MRILWVFGTFLASSAFAEVIIPSIMKGERVSETEYCPSTFSYSDAKQLVSGDCLEMEYGKEKDKKGHFCPYPSISHFQEGLPSTWQVLTKNDFLPTPVLATYDGQVIYCKFTYFTKITKSQKSLYLRRVEK